ncbi:MAG: LytR C-terminal domain-containing protein, partial [Ilumatobacteraceae bacterium]
SDESTTIPVATPAPDRTGFKILVANASGVSGSAGQMTTALQAQQFVVTQPLNADPNLGKLTTTIVYYVPGFEAQATLVADILGGVQILPVQSPPPVEGGTLGEAVVLVLLGSVLAGKLLPGALPSATPATTTTTLVAG